MQDLSIIVTTRNRWTLCANCIAALVNQNTLFRIEIILIDDASKHPAPNYLAGLIHDGSIKYFRFADNVGLSVARSKGFALASACYVSFCDDDDIWPSLMADQLISTLKLRNADVAIGISKNVLARLEFLLKVKPLIKAPLSDLFLLGITPPVSSQAYRKSLIVDVNYYNPSVKTGVDQDLWIRLLVYNPDVYFLKGVQAEVGHSLIGSQMTNQHEKRLSGIQQSLKIWQPILKRCLGDEFTSHFNLSLMDYERFRIFLLCLNSKKFVVFFGFPYILSCSRQFLYIIKMKLLGIPIVSLLRPFRNYQ